MNRSFVVITVLISTIFFSAFKATAETYLVYDTKLYVYAQSPADSQAHLVRSSVGIYQEGEHPSCGNRAYINFADKEIFAMALAASLANKSVNFMYEDDAENKQITGHTMSTCRISSIWQ